MRPIADGAVLIFDLCNFATLAIWRPEHGILAQHIANAPLRNEEALETVAALLKSAQVELGDLKAIVVGSGPGSFTGIRVGLALAMGIATPHQIPVHPCSSLGALLFASRKLTTGSRLALIPGNSGLWYACSETDCREKIIEAEELKLLLDRHSEVTVTGKIPADFSFQNCVVGYFSNQVDFEAWAKWGMASAASIGGLRPNYVMASAAEKSKVQMPDPLLRRMQSKDLSWVAAMEWLANPLAWQQSAFLPFAEENVLPENPPTLGLVMLVGDRGVGYVCASAAAEEAEVLTVAVDPGWRRQGLGLQLMEALLDWAKAAALQAIHLEVRASNHAAQALYNRLGFQRVGERRKYYADNSEDAILMTWKNP